MQQMMLHAYSARLFNVALEYSFYRPVGVSNSFRFDKKKMKITYIINPFRGLHGIMPMS